MDLSTESVEGSSLTLEGIDDIHSGDGLALGVLAVGDSVTDHILKENLENSTSFLVDETRDTLDSSTASQTADGGLGDALDVVAQHLAVALGAALAQALAALAASGHGC